MATPSPYRSLAASRRVALLTHALTAHRESRATYVQRLVARGGGFRAATLQTWSADRLAREVIRLNAETAHDELELLQLLYVDLEPAIQISCPATLPLRYRVQIRTKQSPPRHAALYCNGIWAGPI